MSQSILVITLNQIISDYGIDILKDGKRVIAMFSDYRPDGRAEKNKLRIAYEFDVIGILSKAPNNSMEVSIACNKVIDLLKEQAFIDKSVATSIVCDIADVMKLQYDLSMQPKIPPKQNKTVSQSSTSQKKATVSAGSSQDNKVVRTVEKKEVATPMWIPGSGIGYSTHKNPIHPMQAYEDLESQITMDFSLAYKIFHPLQSLFRGIKMNSKYKIACEWEKAQRYCNVYDACVLDGGGFNPSFAKYKKYNEKYMKKLERKFWS